MTKKSVGNILMIIGCVLLVIVSYGMIENKTHQKELIESFKAIKTEAALASNEGTEKATTIKDSADISILRIPSIQLESPVIEGTTSTKLNRALGMIANLDAPGTPNGSTAIAGHQSHQFGHFFNRLNELQIGDRLELETSTDLLVYEVFDIQIVKPNNVEVLSRQEGISMLSLVTCYPERSNKYRLVVQAKQQEI
ncbi:class D sortase [Psychrobacillus sp. FSL K6-2836]|uniref:class D sortase n=1 Tax=Psychrobacillus sp. FSL K6-2836 TaxID=2921548 RepID=UPI0030F64C3F